MSVELVTVVVAGGLILASAGVARADELDALASAIDANPEDGRAYDAYALAAFRLKRFDDAIKRLKVGVARIADYSEGYYKLAYAFRQKQEWADSADYYRRYIALNPTKTDPYFGLGAALQGLGDKKGAIAAYDKYVALEKAPGKQKFVDQARAELNRLDPSRAPAPTPTATPGTAPPSGGGELAELRAQAEQLKREGRLEESAETYRKAIAMDRTNVAMHNELGSVLFGLKRYAEAAVAFRESTTRDPAFALGWYNLAHAMRKADRKGEAIDAYRTYIRLKPEDPDPYYGLGQTLKALGDAPGAIDAFRKYVAMEKRPEEQKWVDKARAELQALEGVSRPAGSGRATEDKSRIEGINGADDGDLIIPPGLSPTSFVTPWSPEGLLDPFPEYGRGGRMRDLKSPFGELADEDPDGLMDPFHHRRGASPDVALSAVPGGRRRIVAYGQAVAAYRRALARHLESVTASYERGVTYALADDATSATRIWNSVMSRDPELEQARRDLDRLRSLQVAGSRR